MWLAGCCEIEGKRWGMTKEERAAMIRERFKTKHPFSVVENTGKTREGLWRRRPYCMDRNPRGHRFGMNYTQRTATKQQQVERLVRAIGREQTETRAPELRVKRGKRVSAVTKIAEKAPKKLEKKERKYEWQA